MDVMTTPVIVGAAVIVTAALPIAGYLIWLDRQIRKSAAKHAANLEAAVEAERQRSDEEDYAALAASRDQDDEDFDAVMRCRARAGEPTYTLEQVTAEVLAGDTLTLVGAELVHRRCADARRDGQTPGQCCAARLGAKT